MYKKYQRKSALVQAVQWNMEDRPDVVFDSAEGHRLKTSDFGYIPINPGDWIVEIDGKTKILKDSYFRKNYEELPEIHVNKLIFVTDCAD
jgi:hypothetical protein